MTSLPKAPHPRFFTKVKEPSRQLCGINEVVRVSREGDTCHTQSPRTHVPWR